MIAILIIALCVIIVGMALFFKEIKNAQTIDDKEPYLFGDYDPNKSKNKN